MLQNLIFWWNSCQEKKNKFSTKFLVKKKCEYVFRQGGTKINGSIKVVCVQFKLLRFVDKLAMNVLQKWTDLELKAWPSLYLVNSSLSIGLGLIYTVDFWKFVDNKNARCPRHNYCTYLGSLSCVSTPCIVASPEAGNPYRRGKIRTVDLLVLSSFDQLLLILKTLFFFLTNQALLSRRSTVLSLHLHWGFPALGVKVSTITVDCVFAHVNAA